MNQMKRQSNFPDRENKKLPTTFNEKTILITSMKNLSNELFYEIFDYLNGIDIYNAFLNLNHQFQQLLNSSYLLFKIKLDSPCDDLYMNIYQQILLANRHKIFSVYLSMPTYNNQIISSSFNIDSSFIRLESLVFSSIESDVLIILLPKLTSLPRFFSLTIDTWDTLDDLAEIYELIFDLPELRYFKFSAFDTEDSSTTISLSPATNKQLSTIQYLVIDHFCTFNELFDIVSYTPQLRRLKFTPIVYNSGSNIETILPITLSNLTSIYINEVHYKNRSTLKVLRATIISVDTTYLEADRWERLILQYLPQLENIYLQYEECYVNENKSTIYYDEPNQFISSFWLKRQWIFEAEIDDEKIMYSIRPYRYYIKKNLFFPVNDGMIMHNIIFSIILFNCVAKISHLEIHENLDSDRLIDILLSLEELDSIKKFSLSLLQTRCMSCKEPIVLSSMSKKNRITKVNLKTMFDIDEVYFLIELCPRMTYLKVNCINNMDIELFVQFILMEIMLKCNHHLRLLCVYVPTAEDKMVQKLEEMIDSEKLLVHYSIERKVDDIYLQWK